MTAAKPFGILIEGWGEGVAEIGARRLIPPQPGKSGPIWGPRNRSTIGKPKLNCGGAETRRTAKLSEHSRGRLCHTCNRQTYANLG
jgi:hypothetical protein